MIENSFVTFVEEPATKTEVKFTALKPGEFFMGQASGWLYVKVNDSTTYCLMTNKIDTCFAGYSVVAPVNNVKVTYSKK